VADQAHLVRLEKGVAAWNQWRAGNYKITPDLGEATLDRVNLHGAHLIGANLDKAHIGSTIFAGVDLSTALGLETARHQSPSTIGIVTLYRSHGHIPEVFLRGVGVPDQ
jgi:hypothetical protein